MTGISRIRTLAYNHPGLKRNTQRLIKKPKPKSKERLPPMRMWGVDPSLLCRKHLLGEHLEMHLFVGAIQKGISIQGYINKGLVEVHNIFSRHNSLAKEIERRGWHHHSPLNSFPHAEEMLSDWIMGQINIEENKKELVRRCTKCRETIEYEEKFDETD